MKTETIARPHCLFETLTEPTDYLTKQAVLAHRLGIAAGVLFSDTTLQGGDRGSRSLPNSRTLNSNRQNESRDIVGGGGGVRSTPSREPMKAHLDAETLRTFSRWSSVSTMVATRMSMGFLLSTASTFIPIWKPCRGLC